jgi:outer membrane protein TolC
MNRTSTVSLIVAAFLAVPAARAQAPEPRAIDLSQAIARALERSPEIGVARADAEEAHAAARLADAAFRPEAWATTTPGYSSGLPIQVAGQVPAIAGLSLRKTLYDPARRAEAFESRVRAASLDSVRERSAVETVRAVTSAYARNWSGETLLTDARRRLEIREAGLRRISALRREGRQTDLDVERAGLEVARAKQKLSDEQSERALDQLELKRLLDWPAGEPLTLAGDPLESLPVPATDNVALARAADPELKALAQQSESLHAAAGLYERSWRPVIEAEARYLRLASYNNYDQYFVKFKENDFAVGVSIAIPLWTGGRQDEARAASRARLERLEAAQRAREKDIEIALRRAEAELLHAEAQNALAQRAATLARDDQRVIQALADEGRAEPAEVDKLAIALADAEDDSAVASQGLLAARVKLLALTGRLPGVSPDTAHPATAAVAEVR